MTGMSLKTYIEATIILFLLPFAALAQQAEEDAPAQDSINVHDYRYTWHCTILPVSLIGAGTLALAPSFIKNGSRHVTNRLTELRGNARRLAFDDYLQYLPVAGAWMLGSAGIESRHSFSERTLIMATSYVALAVLVNIPKICVDEKRPESSNRNSFPSGHTATAFMGAELVRIEYGAWPAVGAYAIATGVGVMRMYNGKHWLHDVVAGAGVGILSARIGEWSCQLWRKVLNRGKNHSNGLVLLPLAQPVSGGYGGIVAGLCF